jgi:formylglycine-generating enzyme required for sulfatase activity
VSLAAVVVAIELVACRDLIGYEAGDGLAASGPADATVPPDGDANVPDAWPEAAPEDDSGDVPDSSDVGDSPDSSDTDAAPARTCPALDGGVSTSQSCSELTATCGTNAIDDCCASQAVPGGTFTRQDFGVEYLARVSSFRLDRYEVTVGRFRAFHAAFNQNTIATCAGRNPNNPDDLGWDPAWSASLPATATALVDPTGCDEGWPSWTDAVGPNEDRPMNCVSWYVAEAFCIWDHGRLPTETEWEYAARGGDLDRDYPWSDVPPEGDTTLAIWGCLYPDLLGTCHSVANLAPVGSAPGGASRWGNLDMAGNVSEWVEDYAAPYGNRCIDCATLVGGPNRAYRGGHFFSSEVTLLRATERYGADPATRTSFMGFRCARDP